MQYIAKIGSQRIELPEHINDPQQAQSLLAFDYPEVTNAEIRRKEEEGYTLFEFVSKPGRKG